MGDFIRAFDIVDPICDAASIHVVAEGADGRNLYTSVIYGRHCDMRSVPLVADVVNYGTFRAARQRVDKSVAHSFVQAAEGGVAYVGGFAVKFSFGDDVVEGFRPASTANAYVQTSPFNVSLWTREHIGTEKRVGTKTLSRATLWDIAATLDFLDEARWSAIPLMHRPEKLGDLDEWWFSPIEVESRNPAATVEVRISRNIVPTTHSVSVRGTLIANELVVGSISLKGVGPYAPYPMEVDASEIAVSVDGILMDQSFGHYVRTVFARMGIASNGLWNVKAFKGRPAMSFPVGASEHRQIISGAIPTRSDRRDAWEVGRYFRSHGIPDDAERVYGPGVSNGSVTQAFADLRTLGAHAFQPRVRIADPYILDERAMEAIAVSALRDGRVSTIELYTSFTIPPSKGAAVASAVVAAPPASPTLTKRQCSKPKPRKLPGGLLRD
jgi:hypothetical protein